MAASLRRLRIDELSLVDEPANKSSAVTIFKRAAPSPTLIDAEAAVAIMKRQAELIAENEAKLAALRKSTPADWHIDEPAPPSEGAEDVAMIQRFVISMTALERQMGDRKDAEKEARRRDPEGYRLWIKQKEQVDMTMMAKAQAEGFKAITQAIQKRDGCGSVDALQKARTEFPKEFEEWEAGAASSIAKAAESSQRERDEQAKVRSKEAAWHAAVNKLRDGGKVGFIEATATARKIHPDLFEQAFGE